VAIFGLFGKKEDGQPAQSPADKSSSQTKRDVGAARAKIAPDNTARSKQVQHNVARATATAKKIDAIESEMSSEFSPGLAANSIMSGPRPAMQRAASPADKSRKPGKGQQPLPASFEATLPTMGMSTDFLLGEERKSVAIEVANSEVPQVIEEAAILFANDQAEMVEQMLQGAIHDDTPNSARATWWMLFDLYQITGKRQQFDSLSIEYASKFETSPPAWVKPSQLGSQAASAVRKGATPTIPFTGKLDSSNIIKLLERAQKQAESSRVLRLEFSRVTEVDPIGCGLLLRILKKLQSSEHDLILVGAPELAIKIRSILQVGRRDETEAPWLLLLEILRLLNKEKEFEEASIDYCVTFEVSPPAFVAPKNKVTTAAEENASADVVSDCFMMPPIIEGKTDQLISAITAFAAGHNPAVLDCSRLNRVDLNAAGQLLSGLAPLTGEGKIIELHHVNHLVAALFIVMGLKDIVRILPRKH
jgi:ABC-type transporter Mla MlaB component